MTIIEFCGIIVLLGGVVGVFARWVYPAVRLVDRVTVLEEMAAKSEKSNKLLCKAMIGWIDTTLTGNSTDNLKIIKADLMDFISK